MMRKATAWGFLALGGACDDLTVTSAAVTLARPRCRLSPGGRIASAPRRPHCRRIAGGGRPRGALCPGAGVPGRFGRRAPGARGVGRPALGGPRQSRSPPGRRSPPHRRPALGRRNLPRRRSDPATTRSTGCCRRWCARAGGPPRPPAAGRGGVRALVAARYALPEGGRRAAGRLPPDPRRGQPVLRPRDAAGARRRSRAPPGGEGWALGDVGRVGGLPGCSR